MTAPRDYRTLATVLQQDMATMLFADPESFDCLVFPALDASHDETVSIVPDVVGSVESGERAQKYGLPIPARARMIPEEGLSFSATGGFVENFLGATQPINLVLSLAGVRTYSLIQWLEYPEADSEKVETRTVYVLDSKPIGRTLGSGLVHTCLPLPALGEIPKEDDMIPDAPETEESPEQNPDAVLVDVAGGY